MTINDLINRSNYELFKNVYSASHSLYYLLCHIVRLIWVVILSNCLIYTKNHSLFDLLEYIQKIGL